MVAGTFRQRDRHTEDVLRVLTEGSAGGVCLGRQGAAAFRAQSERGGIAVCSSIMSRRQQ